VPAALELIRIESERRAAFEARSGRADRAADDLAPTAFGFDTEPAVVRTALPPDIAPSAREIESQRQAGIGGELVALTVLNRQVERIPAAGAGIAVLVELQVVDAYGRTEEQGPATSF